MSLTRGHERASAGGFTPHSMIDTAGPHMDEIAGMQGFYHRSKFARQQMQFFDARANAGSQALAAPAR